MAISTYSELQAAVANWLADSNISDRVDEFISIGESQVNRDVRVRTRLWEASADLTMTSGQRTTAVPTRFVGVRRLYQDGTPLFRMEYLAPENFWKRHLATQTSRPKFYTIEGENFVWGPAPDQAYTAKLLYWQKPDALSSSVGTFFTDNPDLYLYASLIAAAPFLEDDPRIAVWGVLYDDIADNIKRANRKDRFPIGDMRMVSDVQANLGVD